MPVSLLLGSAGYGYQFYIASRATAVELGQQYRSGTPVVIELIWSAIDLPATSVQPLLAPSAAPLSSSATVANSPRVETVSAQRPTAAAPLLPLPDRRGENLLISQPTANSPIRRCLSEPPAGAATDHHYQRVPRSSEPADSLLVPLSCGTHLA